MAQQRIIGANGKELKASLPKVAGVHPFGSKLLVEVLKADELLNTKLIVSDKTTLDGAPQAYIVELGPQVSAESGLKTGQRIFWTGKGTQIEDPRGTNGRVRALLEVSNILAIIDEAAE